VRRVDGAGDIRGEVVVHLHDCCCFFSACN
jgi:hypothetical protein